MLVVKVFGGEKLIVLKGTLLLFITSSIKVMQTRYTPLFPYLVNFQTDASYKSSVFPDISALCHCMVDLSRFLDLEKSGMSLAHKSQDMESFTGECDPSPTRFSHEWEATFFFSFQLLIMMMMMTVKMIIFMLIFKREFKHEDDIPRTSQ